MAALSDVLGFARTQLQTDSNGLTDTNGIVFANDAIIDFRRQLIAAGVDAAQTQEAYEDATAGQGTYLFPSDMFWLKTIELNYSDTVQQNYKVATQIKVSNIPANKSFGWLRQNANTTSPYFDSRGDQYEIFPTPTGSTNLSQLIRIFYFLEPPQFASTSDSIVYPESLDYRILGWYIAFAYLYSLGSTVGSGRNIHLVGDSFKAIYQQRVQQLIATLSRGSQQPIQETPLQISGWEF